jgi:hypothetical protein
MFLSYDGFSSPQRQRVKFRQTATMIRCFSSLTASFLCLDCLHRGAGPQPQSHLQVAFSGKIAAAGDGIRDGTIQFRPPDAIPGVVRDERQTPRRRGPAVPASGRARRRNRHPNCRAAPPGRAATPEKRGGRGRRPEERRDREREGGRGSEAAAGSESAAAVLQHHAPPQIHDWDRSRRRGRAAVLAAWLRYERRVLVVLARAWSSAAGSVPPELAASATKTRRRAGAARKTRRWATASLMELDRRSKRPPEIQRRCVRPPSRCPPAAVRAPSSRPWPPPPCLRAAAMDPISTLDARVGRRRLCHLVDPAMDPRLAEKSGREGEWGAEEKHGRRRR